MNIGRVERVNHARIQQTATGAGVEAQLLPKPTSSSNDADLLFALQSLLLRASDASTDTAKVKIERNEKLVMKALEEAKEARKREEEARSEDGGFFDGIGDVVEAFTVDLAKLDNVSDPVAAIERSLDKSYKSTIDSRQFWADLEKGALEVAKWGAVAASVTLAVVSCGGAAPVAALAICGAVMSCAAAADSTFHIQEKCGVDRETAGWVNVGLCVGGAICSGAAGFAQAVPGAAATAASSSSDAIRAVTVGATVIDAAAGTAAIAGGAAHIQVAAFERDAKTAEADTLQAVQTQQRLERRIQKALDAVRETLQSRERGLERVNEGMKQHNSALVAVVRA